MLTSWQAALLDIERFVPEIHRGKMRDMSPQIHPLVCGYLIRDHKITDLLSICARQKLVGALGNVQIGLFSADVVRVWILTCIY